MVGAQSARVGAQASLRTVPAYLVGFTFSPAQDKRVVDPERLKKEKRYYWSRSDFVICQRRLGDGLDGWAPPLYAAAAAN